MGHRLVAFLWCVFLSSACSDPPGDGGLQLYFDINVDDAPQMGLGGLVSIEVVTNKVTAKFHSPTFTGDELILDDTTQTTTLKAVTQLVPGPHYTLPSGFITQLRFFPTLVRFHFDDGSSADVRVPSADQTGWKMTVDDSTSPDGYEIVSGHVTGVRMFINLGELFHMNSPQGWMARPTIRSSLYNIGESGGYDPDMLAVVFDPATSQARIDSIISGGQFHVEFAYPHAPPKLYKLKIPVSTNLADAHSYLRGFSEVRAVAPSVRLLPRLIPSEGMPVGMGVMDAFTGWDSVLAATGSIGSPTTVVAEISAESGGINIEHPDLWPNVWLNQGEILAVCGSIAQCDPDGDGLVTLKDFNNPMFSGIKPADIDANNRITCRDLLAPGSPYLNTDSGGSPIDDDGNGFPNDLCGWNFTTQNPDGTFGSNDVLGPDPNCVGQCDRDHDTAAAGIMAAIGNGGGPGVGICWNCRLMPLVAHADFPTKSGEVTGATAELIAAFAYARDNGAHVANLSSGLDLFQKEAAEQCPNRFDIPKQDAFDPVVAELNAVVVESLGDLGRPTTFFTLAGGECGGFNTPGFDEGVHDYYDWPPEAFFSNAATHQIAITVAATNNTFTMFGGMDGSFSNFGDPFEIAAAGDWPAAPGLAPGMLNGTSDNADYSASGTSFSAPAVAGVAALIVSGNLAVYAVPVAPALKTDLLDNNTIVDPTGLAVIPGNRGVTMTNLP